MLKDLKNSNLKNLSNGQLGNNMYIYTPQCVIIKKL